MVGLVFYLCVLCNKQRRTLAPLRLTRVWLELFHEQARAAAWCCATNALPLFIYTPKFIPCKANSKTRRCPHAAAYAVGHQEPSPEDKSTFQLPNSLSQDMRPPWMVTNRRYHLGRKDARSRCEKRIVSQGAAITTMRVPQD